MAVRLITSMALILISSYSTHNMKIVSWNKKISIRQHLYMYLTYNLHHIYGKERERTNFSSKLHLILKHNWICNWSKMNKIRSLKKRANINYQTKTLFIFRNLIIFAGEGWTWDLICSWTVCVKTVSSSTETRMSTRLVGETSQELTESFSNFDDTTQE